jgi:type IV secretory pathway TrbD component
MEPSQRQTRTVHPSLYRPITLAGAEARFVIFEGITVGSLTIMGGFHWASLLLGLFYVLVVHAIMVWVTRRDPQLIVLYLRSLQHPDHYPAHARVGATSLRVTPSIPGR